MRSDSRLLKMVAGLVVGSVLMFSGCGQQATAPPSDITAPSPYVTAQSDPSELRHCLRGQIEGLWIKDEGSEEHGRIEAVWTNSRGDTLGSVAGIFGLDTTTWTLRWQATVSGIRLTVVLFELAGQWTFTDPRECPLCGTSTGAFSGTWRDARSGRRGRVAGEWGDLRLPFSERKMPLSGTWTAPCRSGGVLLNLDQPY